MSIKLYDGLIFKTRDLAEAYRQVAEFREMLKPQVKDRVERWFAREMVARLDDHTIGLFKPQRSSSPAALVWDEFFERQANLRRGEREPLLDMSFSVCILPVNGKLLGLVFTEQPDWRKLWDEQGFTEPYGYWDNTDPDEDATEAEWEQRERDWTEALRLDTENLPPSLAGITVEVALEQQLPPFDKEAVRKHIPSFDERVERAARDLALERRFRETREDGDKFGFRTFFDAVEWLATTDEGQKALEAAKEEVRTKLVPEVTDELLTTKLEGVDAEHPNADGSLSGWVRSTLDEFERMGVRHRGRYIASIQMLRALLPEVMKLEQKVADLEQQLEDQKAM